MGLLLPLAVALSCGDDDVGLAGPSDTGPPPVIRGGCISLVDPVIEDLEGDTWESWASPMFFDRYCIRCHGSMVMPGNMPGQRNGAPEGYNWDDETMVRGMCGTTRTCLEAIRHAAGVVNYMPFNPGPGDPVPTCAERRRLVRWIDGGAP